MKGAFIIILVVFVMGLVTGMGLALGIHKWVNDFADRCEGLDPDRDKPC